MSEELRPHEFRGPSDSLRCAECGLTYSAHVHLASRASVSEGVDWEAEAQYIATASYQLVCCDEPYCRHWEERIVRDISALASRAADGKSFSDGLREALRLAKDPSLVRMVGGSTGDALGTQQNVIRSIEGRITTLPEKHEGE